MRWDLQRNLGLDLDDWLRGLRDWRTLFEFKNEFGQGTKYFAARLTNPVVVQSLAARDDNDGSAHPSLDDWDSTRELLTSILEALIQLQYVTAHADPSEAPRPPRPIYPHVEMRRKSKSGKRNRLIAQLIPGDSWEPQH